MNGDGTICLLAKVKKTVHNDIAGCGAVSKEKVTMLKSGASEPRCVVNAFV
jgi:hypothetical protein